MNMRFIAANELLRLPHLARGALFRLARLLANPMQVMPLCAAPLGCGYFLNTYTVQSASGNQNLKFNFFDRD
jgi:hypothetical protein